MKPACRGNRKDHGRYQYSPMTRLHPQHLIPAVLAVLILASGCQQQQSPVERGIAIEKSFTQAVSWVTWGIQNGYLSKERGRELAPAINEGSAILDRLQAEIAAGGDGTATAAELAPHLERILRAQVEVERAKKLVDRVKPSTKPSGP